MGTGGCFAGSTVACVRCGADHSSPFHIHLKNGCSHTSAHHITSWCTYGQLFCLCDLKNWSFMSLSWILFHFVVCQCQATSLPSILIIVLLYHSVFFTHIFLHSFRNTFFIGHIHQCMRLWSWHRLSNWAWGLHSSRMLHGQAWQQFIDVSGQLSRVPKCQSLANLWRGTYQNSECLNYTSVEASISYGRARLHMNRNLTVFYEHHPDSLYSPGSMTVTKIFWCFADHAFRIIYLSN